MKRIATLFLSIAGLVGLAGQVAAQSPFITSVPFRQSFDPGRLVIKGGNLGLVGIVKLNGVQVPILTHTGTQITAGPLDPQDPGFGTVFIQGGTGGSSATAPIEFTPSLKAIRRANRMDVTIRNGDVGTYVLRGNFNTIPGGVVDSDPPIYYRRFLGSGTIIVATGVVADDQPIKLSGLLIPIQIGQQGNTLKLQATCSIGVGEFASYSNMITIPAVGH